MISHPCFKRVPVFSSMASRRRLPSCLALSVMCSCDLERIHHWDHYWPRSVLERIHAVIQ